MATRVIMPNKLEQNKGLSLANEQLVSLQNELRHLDTSILVDMSRLSDYKRRILHSILVLKYGGLVELSEKLSVSSSK